MPPPSGGTPSPAPPADAEKPKPKPAPKDEAAPKAVSSEPLAVVIGIGDYDNKAIEGPAQALANADHMVGFLKGDLGIDDTALSLAVTRRCQSSRRSSARRAMRRANWLDLVKATKAPEVIVYFAGRAQALDGGDEVLLLPADADPAKPETGIRLLPS